MAVSSPSTTPADAMEAMSVCTLLEVMGWSADAKPGYEGWMPLPPADAEAEERMRMAALELYHRVRGLEDIKRDATLDPHGKVAEVMPEREDAIHQLLALRGERTLHLHSNAHFHDPLDSLKLPLVKRSFYQIVDSILAVDAVRDARQAFLEFQATPLYRRQISTDHIPSGSSTPSESEKAKKGPVDFSEFVAPDEDDEEEFRAFVQLNEQGFDPKDIKEMMYGAGGAFSSTPTSPSTYSSMPAAAAGPVAAEKEVPICRYYQVGECRFGGACRYRHEGPVRTRGPGEPGVAPVPSDQAPPCRYFALGTCTFGDRCHFRHVIE